jgi:transposase
LEGVGTETAASLLIAAGDNTERLKSEAYSDAHLCGVAPIPASSGKSVRHRLNRHGNRDARALYVIALCRMSREERTRAYVARCATEGKTKKEIIRCLKRFIAREVYRILASVSLSKPPILAP